MRKLLLSTFLLACATITVAQAPANPHSTPRGLFEKVSIRPPYNSPESVGMTLMTYKADELPDGCELQAVSAKESPGGFHYQYVQEFQGIPIHNTSLLATLDKRGRILSLISDLKWFTDAGTAPNMSETALSAWIANTYLLGQTNPWQSSKRIWHVTGTHLNPAYLVQHSEGTTVLEKILDANSLQVIEQRDLQIFHHRLGTDTIGTAMVFNPDPLTTSGNTYGGNFVDNLDADHADLNGQRVSVNLQDITFNGTDFVLSGPHVRIVDVEAPTTGVAMSPTGDFNFTRNQQGFEDVMCYFHIDTYQRYLQSIGFTSLLNTGLDCDPHGLNMQDNSHFVPTGQTGRVAFGEGGVDDAEDADVIVHEYGHALSHAALNGGNSGSERQGLDEGLGDYIAASYSKALSYSLWKNTFTWDGHNEFWDGRSASSGQMYPPSSPNIYTYGEIWASTLMEVYDDIGRTACDKVVIQSMYSNAANLTLNDAAHVILVADSLLYGGAHIDEFQRAFCARGIFNGTNVGEECYVPRAEAIGQRLGYEIFPNPSTGEFRVRPARPVAKAQLRVMDALGHVLHVQELDRFENEVVLPGLASGLYWVEISAPDWLPYVQKLQVLAK